MKSTRKKALILFAAVLVAALLLNCALAWLPASARLVDATPQRMLTPSDAAAELVKSLKEKATVTLVASDAERDIWLDTYLTKLAALSENVSYRRVDSAVAAGLSESEPGANSVFVSSARRSRAIANGSLYLASYGYNYYTGESVVADMTFDAERNVVGALEYVTRDDLPTVYALTGLGATALPTGLITAFADANRELRALPFPDDALPADAAAVLIYAPDADLTDAQAGALRAYLSGGGTLLLFTNYAKSSFPNLDSIAAEYGVEPVEGVILEGDSAHYVETYQQYLKPELLEHEATAALKEAGATLLVPLAHALKAASTAPDGALVTPLLRTSEQAYLKTEGAKLTTLERADADLAGPFDLAVLSVRDAGDGQSALLWVSSTDFLNDTIDQSSGYANSALITALLDRLIGESEAGKAAGAALKAESLMATPLSASSSAGGTALLVLLGAGLPVLLIAVGLILRARRYRRRKAR